MTLQRFEGNAPGPKGEKGPTGPSGGNQGMSWPLRTDKEYGAWQMSAQSSFSRANHLQVYPFILARARTFSWIYYWCTQGGGRGIPEYDDTEHRLEFGLWADNGNGYPGDLLWGAVDPAGNFDAGLHKAPILPEMNLSPGPYWLGGVCATSVSAAFMVHTLQERHDAQSLYPPPGLPFANSSGGTVGYIHVDFDDYGAEGVHNLPHPFPPNGVLNGGVDDVPYKITLLVAGVNHFDDTDAAWEFDLESEQWDFEWDIGG